MATEYYLLQQIEALMSDPANWDNAYARETDPLKRLECLTRHYNGHLRQRAVLCLGSMKAGETLPAIIRRANDWVSQVRDAARQSIRQFMVPQGARWLVECLPEFGKLLSSQRDDHARLLEEIHRFLVRPENNAVLMEGLNSAKPDVARLVLGLMLEQQLFTVDVIFERTQGHKNPSVRLIATRAWLRQSGRRNEQDLLTLLKDRYAPVRQVALAVVMDENADVPVTMLLTLLHDNNELVRKRAARVLTERGHSPVAHSLAVFNDATQNLSRRCVALRALDEQKYEDVLALALDCLKSDSTALYKTALDIAVDHLQENARELLLEAMSYPAYSVAKRACRQYAKRKFFLTLEEILRSQAAAPSAEHLGLYLPLSARLGLWEGLQFMLMQAGNAEREPMRQALAKWTTRLNRFYTEPTAHQKTALRALLIQHPDVGLRDKNYLMQVLSA